MGNVDSIPIVSQTKSLFQAIAGDTEGARQTQENFVNGCPIVSQGKSLGQAIAGDTEGARRTQIEFAGGLSNLADGIPVVGHIKGGIHYACGDKNGGDNAMKAASRTIGVAGGGIVGMLVGGPAGAVAGGIAGGAAMDGITTGVDSAIHAEYRPNGIVAAGTAIAKGEAKAGDIFDATVGVAMDGVSGYGAGKIVQKAIDLRQNTKVYRIMTEESGKTAVESKQLPSGYKQGGPMGETWVSENVNQHQRGFIKGKPTNYKSYKIKVKKSYYNKMKGESIAQKGSRQINKGLLDPKNVINNERLTNHPKGKVNIGIKGPKNLAEFNQNVVKISEINPDSIKYSNGATKAVARFGKGSAAFTAGLAQEQGEQGEQG